MDDVAPRPLCLFKIAVRVEGGPDVGPTSRPDGNFDKWIEIRRQQVAAKLHGILDNQLSKALHPWIKKPVGVKLEGPQFVLGSGMWVCWFLAFRYPCAGLKDRSANNLVCSRLAESSLKKEKRFLVASAACSIDSQIEFSKHARITFELRTDQMDDTGYSLHPW